MITTPWGNENNKDEKKLSADTSSETETDDDIIPTRKRSRELSSSTTDKDEKVQSVCKDSDQSSGKGWRARSVVSFPLYTTIIEMFFTSIRTSAGI